MDQHIIDFRDIDWTEQRPGVRYKSLSRGSMTMRMVEFNAGVIEEDWCTKGHVGYVLDGRLDVDFGPSISHLKKGEGLYIAAGTPHRASVPEGAPAVVIFMETA